MIVMKFGGTSVGSALRIKEVLDIVKTVENPVVVTSAASGVTDMLIEAGQSALEGKNLFEELKERHFEILNELGLDETSIRELLIELNNTIEKISKEKKFGLQQRDEMVSFGERLSTRIIAAFFNQQGYKAKQFDAFDVGFVTDDNFDGAEVLNESYEKIKDYFSKNNDGFVPIVTGYIAKSKKGDITTLGRGGSDYTAAIIGSAIGAKEIQIWTDVDGVMTTDPRIVKTAKTIDELSFAEASELAYFGAKVLHPKTIVPAVKESIPVRVLNTHNPTSKGSLILSDVKRTEKGVIGIACMADVSLFYINSTRMLDAHGFLAKVFEIFAKYKISLDVISTSEVSVAMSINNYTDSLEDVQKELEEFADTKIIRNRALICVVGEGMRNTIGLSGRLFTILGNNGINIEMISQGPSEINISCIIHEKDREKAIKVLHEEFHPEE